MMLKNINLKNNGIWIIGDVHGDFEKLLKLIEKIPEKNPNIAFVGDLIDRGKNSREVLNFIRKNKYETVVGNHEELMIYGLEGNFMDYSLWMSNGGLHTIKSYFKDNTIQENEIERRTKNFIEQLKQTKEIYEHKDWIKKEIPAILKFEINKEKPLYVSHSGFDIDNIQNVSFHDLLWNRKKEYPISENGVNVFGHTIRGTDKAFLSKSHICIDSGGYKKKKDNVGVLTALHYPTLERVFE